MAQSILVAEDDKTIQSLISFKLRGAGFKVSLVNNGAEAIEFLKRELPDLLIVDLMMPLVSGKELIVELKKNPITKTIPLIILTAKSLEKEVIEGFSLGADDYIKKPFSPSELVARVKNVLARSTHS
jgi:DNA-binding response OmpR family regulator